MHLVLNSILHDNNVELLSTEEHPLYRSVILRKLSAYFYVITCYVPRVATSLPVNVVILQQVTVCL